MNDTNIENAKTSIEDENENTKYENTNNSFKFFIINIVQFAMCTF